jgi:hypothetical protein
MLSDVISATKRPPWTAGGIFFWFHFFFAPHLCGVLFNLFFNSLNTLNSYLNKPSLHAAFMRRTFHLFL